MAPQDYFSLSKAKARQILRDWNVSHPSDILLEAIAIEKRLVILEKPIKGAAARLLCTNAGGMIVIDQKIKENGRKRFAVAHELGHYELHRNKTPVSICTEDAFLDWYSKSNYEAESNVFAAELLMPDFLFKERCKCEHPAFSVIEYLAEEFQTSLTATAIRFVQLTNHACSLIASIEGKIKWFFSSNNFPYRIIGIGQNLHEYSCAGELFQNGTLTSKPELVPGIAWLEDYKKGEKCQLYEDLKVLPSYSTTLSLVWIHQDRNHKDQTDSQYSSKLDPEKFTPDGKRYRW